VENPIRLGVIGLGNRAVYNVVAKAIAYDDYTLSAVCDIRPDVVAKVVADVEKNHGLKVRGYTDFEDMLKKEALDAVAVQVDADIQVPIACRALEAGCHVMMEVPVAYSLDHCWQLVTTVERTKKTFLLMEQIRYSGYIQAWRHIVQTGVIGKPLFVEGEYFGNKPDSFFQDERGRFYNERQSKLNPQARPTWRHRAPTISYLPHELSPMLHVLEDRVVKVVGMSVREKSYKYDNIDRADIQVALMHTEKDTILRMAVAHTLPAIRRGELVSHWHHIKGTEGVLEWRRGDKDQCKLFVDKWQLKEPLEVPWSTLRTDAPPEAAGSGHGGVDYFTFACFADAVLRGVPLEFDVYKAVETAVPAILAAKSIAEGSMPQEAPDFRPGPARQPGQMPKGI
jgi:predicted dehydrogenase